MTDINIDEIANKAIADLKDGDEIKASLQAIKTAWGSETNWIKKAFKAVAAGNDLVADVVEYVERLAVDYGMVGAQKKELAVAIINKLMDLPILNENLEAVVIGFAIDCIVAAFNRLAAKAGLGKNWLDIQTLLK